MLTGAQLNGLYLLRGAGGSDRFNIDASGAGNKAASIAVDGGASLAQLSLGRERGARLD